MSISALITKLNTEPTTVNFSDVINVIDSNYIYQPARFVNGDAVNDAGTNEGSCKIFAFALLNELSIKATLASFGQYYRDDVLLNPQGDDHANIRNFMVTGWKGISFDNAALVLKETSL